MADLYELARMLRDALEGSIYEKVVVDNVGPECAVLVAKRRDTLHLIAFSVADGWLYAKIALGDAVPARAWSCSNIFYTPYGLYAFATSLEGLVRKIAAKQPRLDAQAKLLEEALRQGLGVE